jgi:uncharacterized protein (DUF885 family)
MERVSVLGPPSNPAVLSRRLVLAGGVAAANGGAARAQLGTARSNDAQKLNQLIADSAKAEGDLDPLQAIRHGAATDDGGAFVDPLSDDYAQRRLQAKTAEMSRLSAIDRAALSPTGQIAYDAFRYKLEEALSDFFAGVFVINRMTPLDPSFGLQVTFPDSASGAGAPFKTLRDYENGLHRLQGFSGYLQNVVARLKEGRAKGYLQPKILVTNVLAEVDVMLALKVEDTPFYQPLNAMPTEIAAGDHARLQTAYRQAIETEVLPGYQLWKAYLTTTYLPAARDAPGLWAMKDGPKVYAAALRHHTTTDLTADDIHKLGLSEVARIHGELDAVRQTIGFNGDLHAFFDHVRTDRHFYFTRPQDLLDRFKAIEARIWLGIPRLFNRKPKAPFEVRPLPSMGEARGTGYYSPGAPDGTSPGVLYFNMSMLSTRPIPTLETLTLHEGIPGHHFQGSLAQENTALPDILRFGGGFTAYIEGWGLYSESLGKALGLFQDPYQWFGHLDFEMLRAVRLVVDTGMHAKGWSREQAIAFMTDNTSMAAKDIRVEIDRYIAAPGQATAYKVGELKLKALRTRAETVLGPRYDIKNFHDQVLMTGSMPLATLEAKIDGWIARGGPVYVSG